jgi:protein phosphatase
VSLFGSKKSGVHVTVFGKTDVGRTREHNEDCFIVADLTRQLASLKPEVREHDLGERGTLFVVADGMGGAAAGEVASEMATQVIYEHMIRTWCTDEDATGQQFAFRLKEAVEAANAQIHRYAKEHPEMKGMGTTTTGVGILDDQLYLTQVGDSRAYLVRKDESIQLTKDQSLMQRLVDAGELTEEEAERSERRNIILQALGPDERVRVDLTSQQIRRGDAIMICSDGLSGQVTREEIGEIVAQDDKDLVAVCSELIELANERGGPDNITVVVARFGGDQLDDPDGDEDVGHKVYPLTDPESTTEPVPVYKGSPPPQPENRAQLAVSGAVAAAAAVAALFLATMGI